MHAKKIFLSLALGILTTQGAFTSALANDLSEKCGKAPNIPATNDETKRYEALNNWLNCMELGYKDLVDPKVPGGLNYEKVTQRQKIIRTNNSISMKTNGRSEVTSNIMNLEKVIGSLPRVEAMNTKLEELREELAKENEKVEKNGELSKANKELETVNKELGKFKNKILFRSRSLLKEKKEIIEKKERITEKKEEIAKEIQSIEKKISDSNGWLDKELVMRTIEGQKKEILESLKGYGLTKELLDTLPPQ